MGTKADVFLDIRLSLYLGENSCPDDPWGALSKTEPQDLFYLQWRKEKDVSASIIEGRGREMRVGEGCQAGRNPCLLPAGLLRKIHMYRDGTAIH